MSLEAGENGGTSYQSLVTGAANSLASLNSINNEDGTVNPTGQFLQIGEGQYAVNQGNGSFLVNDPNAKGYNQTISQGANGKAAVSTPFAQTPDDTWGTFADALAPVALAVGAGALSGAFAGGTAATGSGLTDAATGAGAVSTGGSVGIDSDVSDWVSSSAGSFSSGLTDVNGVPIANVGGEGIGATGYGGYNAAADSAAADAAASGSGLSLNQISQGLKGAGQLAQGVTSIASGISGSNQASKVNSVGGALQNQIATGLESAATAQSNYETNLMDQYLNLIKNPSSVQNLPGYQFQLQQGEQAVETQEAAGGRAVSGNTSTALATFGQGLASSFYGQQAGILATGMGINTQAGVEAGLEGAAGALEGSAQAYTNAAPIISGSQAGIGYGLGQAATGASNLISSGGVQSAGNLLNSATSGIGSGASTLVSSIFGG